MNDGNELQQLATGQADFARLRTGLAPAKYVDKTAILWQLARNDTDAQYFISRPRRFGKSLMLSTFKALFEGRRELFRGLAVDSLDWDWETKWPVLHFTMADANGGDWGEMKAALEGMVERLCRKHGVEWAQGHPAAFNFGVLLQEMAAKAPRGQIVVLVDEYDEPVAKFLNDLPVLAKARAELHDFYEKLKTNAGIVRFLMMTGVTKLTKLSVFSGLNHLTDLSMDPRCATMLGYTAAELDGTLRPNVEAFGAAGGKDFAAAKAELLSWYDGYRFSPDSEEKVCNPVSVGKALATGKLRNYWEATGQSTMIVSRIRQGGRIPSDWDGVAVSPLELDTCDAETMPLAALMYQGGYLTIRDADEDGTLTLGIPNREVGTSLSEGYVSLLLGDDRPAWTARLRDARQVIRAKGVERMARGNLRAAFAAVPHEWRIESEKEAKRYFLLFMKLCGAEIAGELQSARGRADAVIKDAAGVWVFEFKYGKSAREALAQAREKDYAGPWLDGASPVWLVGVNYDPETRTLDEPLVEKA